MFLMSDLLFKAVVVDILSISRFAGRKLNFIAQHFIRDILASLNPT